MNTFAIRSAFAAAMIAGTIGTAALVAPSRAYAAADHPDFGWQPTRISTAEAPVPGNRLYVGNLSGPIGDSN